MNSINITGYAGMNNVITENGMTGGGDGSVTAIPKVILNADVTPDKKLKKRSGFSLFASLPNSHSIWGTRGIILASSDGYLRRLYPDSSIVTVCALGGPQDERLFYAVGDKGVYISSRYWMGVFNPQLNSVSEWGIPLPEQPVLSLGGGGALPAGRYQVCYTNVVDGQIGGNGMIAEIDAYADNASIALVDRPENVIAWITDADGSVFSRAITEGSVISSIDTVEPLPTFMCYPPQPMQFIRNAFGRMWGVIDNKLVYSEPFRPDLFKRTNVFSFPEDITLAAFVEGGVYAGMGSKTVFLAGTEPSNMREADVAGGVAKSIMAYCNNVPDLGNNIPIWVSREGLVAGSHSGSIVKITKDRLQFPSSIDTGAAIQRTVNGQSQYLASMKQAKPRGSGVGFGDSATCEVVRNGKVL